MSLVVESDRSTKAGVKQRCVVYVEPSKRVVVARPGSRAEVLLHVESSNSLEVRLLAEGLEPTIAIHTLSPERGYTPFTSSLELLVSRNAVGIYPFRVTAKDTFSKVLSITNLVLVILPQNLPVEIVNYLRMLLSYYDEYGIQYVIWFLLSNILRDSGMSFTDIKTVYEFFKGRKVSNGTVGDLVERMTTKGIIVKEQDRYYTVVDDEELILELIDAKRVRSGRKGAKQPLEALATDPEIDSRCIAMEETIPLAVRRVLRAAEKLVEQGQTQKALGLIQHSLVGVRETGRWVLWVDDIFIYKERKAKPNYHYFRSEKLAEILQDMGFRQGFVHAQPVDYLIKTYFQGDYREARRIHYILKDMGWITYGPPLVLYILAYPDNTGGFRLETIYGELVAEVNYNPAQTRSIAKHIVMPEEHVDKRNDETYFRYR